MCPVDDRRLNLQIIPKMMENFGIELDLLCNEDIANGKVLRPELNKQFDEPASHHKYSPPPSPRSINACLSPSCSPLTLIDEELKQKKSVSFNYTVSTILVPQCKEYHDFHLSDQLWWSKEELTTFRDQFRVLVNSYRVSNPHVSRQTAIKAVCRKEIAELEDEILAENARKNQQIKQKKFHVVEV